MDAERLAAIRHRLFQITSSLGGGVEIKPHKEAKAAWAEQYYRELTKSKPGFIGCIVNRAEAQVLRLAMIYAIIDGCTEIKLGHLESAVTFWTYGEQSADYIFHGRQLDNVAHKILQALADGPKSRTDLHRIFCNHKDKQRLDTALSELVATGTIVSEKRQTGGRPVKWYHVRIAAPAKKAN